MAKDMLESRKELEKLASTFYKETGIAVQMVYFTWVDVTYMDVVVYDKTIQKIEFTMT